MQYIPVPFLSQKLGHKRLSQGTWAQELGELCGRMALTRAHGFGHLRDASSAQGRYDTLEEAEEHFVNHYVASLEDLGGLDADEVRLALHSFRVLAEATSQSALIHNDLQSGNVLSTRPLAVIDPHPFVGHPCLALARPATALGARAVEPLLNGFRRYSEIDSNLVRAAIRV